MREAHWFFGYGSLVFRPGFAFIERRPAYVSGFVRRFYQGSPDHRGVPGAPGRVVTLLEAPGERCYGAAFRVEAQALSAITEALDHREKGGYQRIRTALFDPEGTAFAEGTLYWATEDNPHYLGPDTLAAMAAQIRASSGPSGRNIDYVRNLAEALREMGVDDPHTFALEALLAGEERP